MVVTPDTEVYLVRFDVTKEHQLTFDNIQSQEAFFQTLALSQGVKIQPSSYQRQDYKIRFPAWLDEIENYNYCFFKNPSYSNKWYYCYITNMEYKNDGLTDVTIKIDVFQTYQFDFIYKRCFVEREHVNSDKAGEHTVPEGLETGEYYVNSYEYYTNFDNTCLVVTASKPVNATSQYPNDTGVALSSLNGIITYGKVYICENPTILNNLLLGFSNNTYSGGTDSITNMYFVPKTCIDWNDVTVVSGVPDLMYEYSSSVPMIYHYEINKPSTIDSYTPKNKKLLTFPYCFLVASNNNGSSNIYKYEKFKNNKCEFDFSCIPTPGASIKMSPYNYTQNYGYDEEEGLISGKFPFMNWATQYYNDWISRNSLNLTGQFVIGTLQTVGGFYTQNPEGIIGGLSNTLSVVKQMYDHKMIPDSARGNINGADINTAQDQNGFYFYKKSINSEFAKIIDNFFTQYGYKVSTLKLPNITGRSNWNYVKTIDSIVESNIVPEKYLIEFKEMLNKGITFWHDYSTFMDYSKSNNIV